MVCSHDSRWWLIRWFLPSWSYIENLVDGLAAVAVALRLDWIRVLLSQQVSRIPEATQGLSALGIKFFISLAIFELGSEQRCWKVPLTVAGITISP